MIVSGLDVLLGEREALVAGRRIGLLCHAASVDHRLRHSVDLLAESRAELKAIFAPEHGVWGAAQDMVAVEGARDTRHDVPVYSLYGQSEASLEPEQGWLAGLDLVVIDLQDVGSRYYTYVWSAALMAAACARAGVETLVLDRPNPLGGVAIEGPAIEEGYESFVGLHDVPARHALTIGELVMLTCTERGADTSGLSVLPMRGWRREMLFSATGLPWVMPSPNMPSEETALVYPGGCLFEGTNLSEGRGTTRPFELVGAPWIDGHALAEGLAREDLPGVSFRPLRFSPTFHKYAGLDCGGVQLHVVDRASYRPMQTAVALLSAFREQDASRFGWREQPYEFVCDRPAIDLLAGGAWLREGIERGQPIVEMVAPWRQAERAFAERRRPYLLYEADREVAGLAAASA